MACRASQGLAGSPRLLVVVTRAVSFCDAGFDTCNVLEPDPTILWLPDRTIQLPAAAWTDVWSEAEAIRRV